MAHFLERRAERVRGGIGGGYVTSFSPVDYIIHPSFSELPIALLAFLSLPLIAEGSRATR